MFFLKKKYIYLLCPCIYTLMGLFVFPLPPFAYFPPCQSQIIGHKGKGSGSDKKENTKATCKISTFFLKKLAEYVSEQHANVIVIIIYLLSRIFYGAFKEYFLVVSCISMLCFFFYTGGKSCIYSST